MQIKLVKGYKELMANLEDEFTLVGVGPENCPECKNLEPMLMSLWEKYKDKNITFIRCIIDEEAIDKLSLISPALIAFKEKKEIKRLLVEHYTNEEEFIKDVEVLIESNV